MAKNATVEIVLHPDIAVSALTRIRDLTEPKRVGESFAESAALINRIAREALAMVKTVRHDGAHDNRDILRFRRRTEEPPAPA